MQKVNLNPFKLIQIIFHYPLPIYKLCFQRKVSIQPILPISRIKLKKKKKTENLLSQVVSSIRTLRTTKHIQLSTEFKENSWQSPFHNA